MPELPAGGRRWRWPLLVGAGEMATGALLLAAPAATLRVLALPPPGELVWLRFIGAFVCGVGGCYWLGGGGASPADRGRRAAILESTALQRICIAFFVGAAIIAGALPSAWGTVAGYDLTLAAAQLWWRFRGEPGNV